MKDVDNYGGVIVLSDAQSNEVLMTDIYTDNTRKQMWMQWVKVAVEKFCLNPKRYCHFVLKDYYTGRTEVFRKRRLSFCMAISPTSVCMWHRQLLCGR